MTLHAIVAALGGDLYAHGQRANVPAPGHSPRDRSVSLWLTRGRVVAHSFGGADWREVLADLRARGLVDAAGAPASGGPGPSWGPSPTAGARIAAARRLWDQGVTAGPGSPAARHGLGRGVRRPLAAIPELRAHPAAPVSVYRPGAAVCPALLAAIRDPDGRLTAVEVSYLDGFGRRAARLRLPRKTVGRVLPGSAVRLDRPDAELLVAEGVFSALSAGERFGLPAWALLSAGNLRRWRAPPGIGRVVVAGDRGAEGERSAAWLAVELRRQGVTAEVVLPPDPFGDWNEAAPAAGRREVGRIG